jgi:hypothetical protein
VPGGGALAHRVDDRAEQRRAGQRGERGGGVEADGDRQGAPVPARDRDGVGAHLRRCGDRQRAHGSSPLVTTAR